MWATAAPLLAVAACGLMAVDGVPTAPATVLDAAAPVLTVGEVIKNHANLTSFAAALESASSGYDPYGSGALNLSSFLFTPAPEGLFGYTVLAPSDAAFAALGDKRALLDVAALRYEILSHHINLDPTTPNTVCADADAPLPGYNVTTAASQTLAISCSGYTRPAALRPLPQVTAKHTLGNATFAITSTPIKASNGVVVVIDGILLPAWLPPDRPIKPAPPYDNEPLVFRAISGSPAHPDCGQVDAASSVPPEIYKDEGRLKRYIEVTLEYYTMRNGLKLELGTCAEAGFTTTTARLPPESIVWTFNRKGPLTFSYFCAGIGIDASDCGCIIGFCPEVPPPDKPICAVCNGVLNRPREIDFFIRGDTPAPPPPPDIFGFVLDAMKNSPELSTLYRIVQGNATRGPRGPYERECPRGRRSPDCSFPDEEPDGRQTFTGTIESKGPWTFFAPDNAAFDKAPALKASLLAGWENGRNELFLDNLFDTLYYHLLEGNYSAAQLPSGDINTLEGADITTSHLGKLFTFVTGGTTTNVARVKKSIEVTNGVVHIISAVLTPPADTRPSKQQGYNTCCAAGVGGPCCDACCKGGNIQCC